MDATVLTLQATGLALTTAGLVLGAVDVARRVRRYRFMWDTSSSSMPMRPRRWNPRLYRPPDKTPATRSDLDDERQMRLRSEARLANVAGLTANLRTLALSALVALAGVLVSGAGDVLAATRTR